MTPNGVGATSPGVGWDGVDTENRLARIGEKYVRGVAVGTIASDEKIAVQSVSQHLATIRERWREQAILDFGERLALEIAKIDALEREYWDAWQRSKADQVTTETIRESSDGDVLLGKPSTETGEPFTRLPARTNQRARAVKKGQVGQAVWLNGVQWCIETRLKALGVLPTSAHGTIPEGRAAAAGSLDELSPEERQSRLRQLVDGIASRATANGAIN